MIYLIVMLRESINISAIQRLDHRFAQVEQMIGSLYIILTRK